MSNNKSKIPGYGVADVGGGKVLPKVGPAVVAAAAPLPHRHLPGNWGCFPEFGVISGNKEI